MVQIRFARSQKIAKLEKDSLQDALYTDSLFKDIDSNIEAWLDEEIAKTFEDSIYSYDLLQPLDNKQVLELMDDPSANAVTLGQVKYMVETDSAALIRNGFSNLFLILGKSSEVYIFGLVFDGSVDGFVPYIYRTRNLYRAWNKGNRIHIKSKLT